MSETKHTPTPWVYDEKLPCGVYSDDATGSRIATTGENHLVARSYEEDAANAAFIVKAVNCHDELLEALKKLLRTAEEELVDADHALGVYEARVAIAKAEPTTPSTTAQEGQG